MLIHLSLVCDCFHVQWPNGLAVTEAIRPAKDQNIYSVAHFRKSALFPGVDKAIFRRRTEAQPKRYRCRKITTMNKWAWSEREPNVLWARISNEAFCRSRETKNLGLNKTKCEGLNFAQWESLKTRAQRCKC